MYLTHRLTYRPLFRNSHKGGQINKRGGGGQVYYDQGKVNMNLRGGQD